jgi:hypothetical protein
MTHDTCLPESDLFSLINMIISINTHFPEDYMSFFFMTEQYSIVYIFTLSLFIHPLMGTYVIPPVGYYK